MEEIKPKKGFFATIKEMIGRVEPNTLTEKIKAVFHLFSHDINVDYSKVNYALTKAIYYASVVTDKVTGREYGEKFKLGAVFGKPIVNSAASFIIGSPIQIETEQDDFTKNKINDLLKKNNSYIQLLIRNSLRSGDSYLEIDEMKNFKLLDPAFVDKIVDPLNIEDVKGFDISIYTNKDNSTLKELYKIEHRKGSINIYKIDGSKKKLDTKKSKTFSDTNPLPIIHFPNEPEPNALYGNSEYQSCYTLMANYHAVLENAIKGDIFNSTPVPYITGIKDISKFIQNNGELDAETGQYQIDWNKTKLLLGGDGTKFGMMQADDTTGGSKTLLEILFWGICQTSETPEFIMGNAVQSSKASTETQMPVMVAKAKRKQGVFTKPIRQMIDLLLFRLNQEDSKIKTNIEYDIIWPDIISTDEALNLDRAKLLSEQEIATKETIGRIAGLGEYVKDIDKEIERAKIEYQDKQQKEADLYAPAGDIEEDIQTEENNQEENANQ